MINSLNRAQTLSGSQQPRICKLPSYEKSLGDYVIAFGEACGVQLLEWQKLVVRNIFGVDDAGSWTATETGLLVARQNGKGEILVVVDLAHLFLFPREDNRRKTILHSAHEFKTAVDGFDRLRGVIEANPALMAKVENIYTGAGQQQIILKKRPEQRTLGDRIKFVARSKSSGRGFSADVLIYDEAQELPETARDALTYTATTITNKQEIFVGTVPDENVNEFEVFEGLRDRGRSPEGENANTLWLEWSPAGSEDYESAPGIDDSDVVNWLAANPSAGELIPLKNIREQWERDNSPGRESFRRERLSIWPNRPPEEEVALNDLDLGVWDEQETPKQVHGENLVLSVRIADNGGYASISCASELPDGRYYVEHLYTAHQTLWVPAKLKALSQQMGAVSVVLDEKKCATVLPDLKRERIKFFGMRPGELAGAHTLFIELVNSGQVVHRGQPELTDSLRLASPRAVGQYGFTWEQSDPSEPVTPAQTVTEAVWGVKNFKATRKTPGAIRGYGG